LELFHRAAPRNGIHAGIKIKIEKKRLSYKNIFSIVARDPKTRLPTKLYTGQRKMCIFLKLHYCAFVDKIISFRRKTKINVITARPTLNIMYSWNMTAVHIL